MTERDTARLDILRAVRHGSSITTAIHALAELEDRALVEQREAIADEILRTAGAHAGNHASAYVDGIASASDIARNFGKDGAS